MYNNIDKIGELLKMAKQYWLITKVITAALNITKNNSKLAGVEALNLALQEWSI